MERPFIFEVDADIIKRSWLNSPNYLIQYSDELEDREYCAVYFSSNNIYYPSNEYIFRKRIIEKNFYEWYSTRVRKAHKHIFVRDVFKQWYLTGINSTIHSPELLLEFLKKETNGYKVITIGSSAGGYAAILYGSQLNAEKVFAFNPQIKLIESFRKTINPFVIELKETMGKYYDLCCWMNNTTDVFYIYSAQSEIDIKQYNYLKKANGSCRIHRIGFVTSHHGIPFLKVCLPKVLNMDSTTLISLSGKIHNPWIFSVRIAGFRNALTGLIHQVYLLYRKRILG